jgi:integrase
MPSVQAENELANATFGRLLSRFIQDRAESNDYRKHLGLLALVRQDFADIQRRRFPAPARPSHMLRHACGFALADQGADTRLIQDYLGHRNIQHTVKYTATNPTRFEKLWR